MKYVYSWYDTEDGHECVEKIMYLSKRGFLVGTALYPLSAMIMKPTTYRQFGLAYVCAVVPIVGMSAMFSFTTCVLCRYAPIPEKISYTIGGLSAGSVLGAVTRSPALGLTIGGYLGIAGFMARYFHENDISLVTPDNIQMDASFGCMEMPDWTMQNQKELPLPSSNIAM